MYNLSTLKVYKHSDPKRAPGAVSLHSRWGTSGSSNDINSINGNKIIFRIQIGQPHDLEVSDVTVVNLTAENTGDDSLALFNVVQDAKISDCYIRYRVLIW